MLKVNWKEDGRESDPLTYTDNWGAANGRLTPFLGGWTDWAKNDRHKREALHWRTVGALYASAFGSHEAAANVPERLRCELYHIALMAYVNSQKCAHWTQQQRERALELSWDEVERRGGTLE